MQTNAPEKYQFAEFQLDILRRRLLRDEKPITLNPKAFDMLLILVKNCGKLLSKEDLFQTVWEDQIVEESNLTVNMSQIRRALGEKANEPRFITTISGQGYRFLADVQEVFTQESLVLPNESSSKTLIEEKPQSDFHTLAVLPFKTLGETEENQYLALGMADAIITKLSNLRQLRVRPTSAVLKFGVTGQNPIEAGQELRVQSIIEGSIWQLNERLRVTVQMVNVADESTLWADKFDEAFTDIFAIQDSISERIVSALQFRLTGNERKQLTKHETENSTAYQLYLRALYLMNSLSAETTVQAIAYLEKAIEADPNYALAYTSLFGCMVLVGMFSAMPPDTFTEKARRLAAKALELDPMLPASHYSQGFAYLLFDWDFEAAEKSLLRAIELNPQDAETHRYYSFYLFIVGRHEEAIREAEFSLELEPTAPVLIVQLAHTFYFARQYDRAIAMYRKFLEIEPKFQFAHIGLARSYTEKGMFQEAEMVIDDVDEAFQNYPRLIMARGYISAKKGDENSARQAIEKLLEMSKSRYVAPFDIAVVYSGLNETDKAFVWLEKAFAEHSILLPMIKTDPYFDNLRSDSQFDDLLKRIGF